MLSEKATYGDLQPRSQFRAISPQVKSFASYARHEDGMGKGGFLREIKKKIRCVGPFFTDLVCAGENGNMVRLPEGPQYARKVNILFLPQACS